MGVVLLATLTVGACGDDSGDGASGVSEPVATSTTGATVAPTPTEAPSRPLTGTLEPRTEYTVGDTVGPLTVAFRTGDDPMYLDYEKSTFYVYRSPQITDLSVSDMAAVVVSEEGDPANTGPQSLSPAPADLLEWLAARPFFEVVEPRRPISAGEASGEVITLRTRELTTAANPLCGPQVPVCAVVTALEGAGPLTTTSGETTDFAVLEAGGTKAHVIAVHDAVGQALLDSLRISAN
jgi:hypothetical protein